MFTFLKRFSRKAPRKIVAVIAARNEQYYLRKCVEGLIDNDLEVAVLDNESTDATPGIISDLSPKLLFHGEVPFDGTLNLPRLLQAKMALARRLEADWIVHVDADEILRSCVSGETLRAGIERAYRSGANVVNFHEFVFVPKNEEEDYRGSDYVSKMKWYYFFDRSFPWRMLAFSSHLSNVEGAGHTVDGKVALHGEDFVMCHYISLSHAMFREKYKSRTFSADGLAKGWHGNRINIHTRRIGPEIAENLKYWQDGRVESLDKSCPKSSHFWEW